MQKFWQVKFIGLEDSFISGGEVGQIPIFPPLHISIQHTDTRARWSVERNG